MVPSSTIALAVLIVGVLPGSMYTWAFERQAGAYGSTLADRALRFVAISVILHLALGWGEYWLFREAFSNDRFWAGEFAAAWGAVCLLVAIPAVFGGWVGSAYANRATSKVPKVILRLLIGPTPAPSAWDNIFSERPAVHLRIETVGGETLAGVFADKSYAGGFPHQSDLYLEEAWSVGVDGSLNEPLGFPVYIPSGQIARMELMPQLPEESSS